MLELMSLHEPIHVANLTKTFGRFRAVDNLSFTVQPGRVTGFLGPNGSGKTTTLRVLLGLTKASAGTATFGATPYVSLANPAHRVGAALEASSFHPGRNARDHLLCYAPLAQATDARCFEVLEIVGLLDAARKRVSEFSMGMRQRLALATALLGDPDYLLLDEPANGLDPQGIRWLRDFLRYLASEGKTVLISSHILSEVQQSVDDVVIISHGQLRHASSITDMHQFSAPRARVLTPQPEALWDLARANGWAITQEGQGFIVYNLPTAAIGGASFAVGIALHELTDVSETLEDAFLRLTSDPAPGQFADPAGFDPNQPPGAPAAPVAPIAPAAGTRRQAPNNGPEAR